MEAEHEVENGAEEMSHAEKRGLRGLDITHQWPQTGDLVACWAFVLHYYQAMIRQAHGQLSIPSEGSGLSPSSLPSHAVTTI